MKIIETNVIMIDSSISNHQSRVIEVPSWEEYCDLFRNYSNDVTKDLRLKCSDVFGSFNAEYVSLRYIKIINLLIDEHHLLCEFLDQDGSRGYKLAYVVQMRA